MSSPPPALLPTSPPTGLHAAFGGTGIREPSGVEPVSLPGQQPSALPCLLPGADERGWPIFVVPAMQGTSRQIYKSVIGHRYVELVAQDTDMYVYLNPIQDGADEWEVPPGSGVRMLVISPPRPEKQMGEGVLAYDGAPLDGVAHDGVRGLSPT